MCDVAHPPAVHQVVSGGSVLGVRFGPVLFDVVVFLVAEAARVVEDAAGVRAVRLPAAAFLAGWRAPFSAAFFGCRAAGGSVRGAAGGVAGGSGCWAVG